MGKLEDKVKLAEASWNYIIKEKGEFNAFVEDFFNTIITNSGEEYKKFFSKPDYVKKEGAKMVNTIASFSISIQKLSPTQKLQIANLAVLHNNNGVDKLDYFQVVGTVFQKTIEKFMGDKCTPEILDAWKDLYMLLVDEVFTKPAKKEEERKRNKKQGGLLGGIFNKK